MERAALPDEGELRYRLLCPLQRGWRLRWRSFEDDGELIPPSRATCRLAAAAGERSRQLPQQFIPGRMPGRVVDDLELVQVHEQHGGFTTRIAVFLQRRVQSTLEAAPVEQARQRIMGGLVGHLGGDAPCLGHIVEHQDGTDDVVTDIRIAAACHRSRTGHPAVLEDRVLGQSASPRAEQHHFDRIRCRSCALFGNDQHVRQWNPAGFLGRPTRHPLGHGIQVGHTASGVVVITPPDRIEGDAQALLFVKQFELAFLLSVPSRSTATKSSPCPVSTALTINSM